VDLRAAKISFSLMFSILLVLVFYQNCAGGFSPVSSTFSASQAFCYEDPMSIDCETSPNQLNLFAGDPSVSGSASGPRLDARFGKISDLVVDSFGQIYVADDGQSVLRRIAPVGTVTVVAGEPGQPGLSEGSGNQARFASLTSLALDSSGNIYIADELNHRIRKVTPAGVVSTYAGGAQGYSDGPAADALFDRPNAVALDAQGNLFVCDSGNRRIRRVSAGGAVSTTVAFGNNFSCSSLAVNAAGAILISDLNHVIYRIVLPLDVTTFAGMFNQSGTADGAGDLARFNTPRDIYALATGDFLLADSANFLVRRITSAGVVSTFAGTAGVGSLTAGPLPGGLPQVNSVAAWPEGNRIYIATDTAIIQSRFQ